MKNFRFILTASLLLLPFALPVQGQDLNALKTSIQARIGQIDGLKMSGVVGENNKGLLEARGSLSAEQKKLMDDENRDRMALNGIIAGRTGTNAEQVGMQFSKQVRERSAAGIWLQDDEGKWYKK